ncbi:Protein TIFY 5A [Apostasia shenzhenica]|uniref:Protein TIFY 5A n=1 Tax=Apostasia shenzhenica TaxID=1088818 RepID=A0A2I0B869_9ASPA|nr:Protein TIFY 5A [Apostasia shenzhenica]
MASSNVSCDTELRLFPGCQASRRPAATAGGGGGRQLTLFYGGRVSNCDITEIKSFLQARAILCMAREMEETVKSGGKASSSSPLSFSSSSLCHWSTWGESQLLLMNPDLSMKRSLQRFLQKRKTRLSGNCAPYRRSEPQDHESFSSSASSL